jgi:hypothetical protein
MNGVECNLRANLFILNGGFLGVNRYLKNIFRYWFIIKNVILSRLC